ncbi:MAG TPA: hypothetical protein VK957_18920, partial [Lunatimonas sp.]|nr:hypothetical protein [Lunatimonas sp.]
MVKLHKLSIKNKIKGKIKRIIYFLKAIVFGIDIPLYELKGICSYLSKTNQHKIFEFLLYRYDPKIKFVKDFNSKKFYGYGCGSGNLNVYRKFIYENEILFEKIYFKHCKDFHNINWFYNNLYCVITDLGLRIPIVKRIKEGDKLCIFYYEFLKLGDSRNYEDAFNVSNLLYKNRQLLVSSHHQLQDDQVFRRGEVRLIKHLQAAGINLDRYKMFKERMLKCLPVYFQHGDLTTNCYKYNFVLDWDRSGYYPFGVDYGF